MRKAPVATEAATAKPLIHSLSTALSLSCSLADQQLCRADVVGSAERVRHGEHQPADEGGLILARPPGQELPAARVPPGTALVIGQAIAARPDLQHDAGDHLAAGHGSSRSCPRSNVQMIWPRLP